MDIKSILEIIALLLGGAALPKLYEYMTARSKDNAAVKNREIELQFLKEDTVTKWEKIARRRGQIIRIILNSINLIYTIIHDDYSQTPNIQATLNKAIEQMASFEKENDAMDVPTNKENGK